MTEFTAKRFILIQRNRVDSIMFLPFFAKDPKECWELCEGYYGKGRMDLYQDQGFTAVEMSMSLTLP